MEKNVLTKRYYAKQNLNATEDEINQHARQQTYAWRRVSSDRRS
jgi:hypothetical protein